eukprot:scaffold4148_cov240-Pinguiococcus_pyrenoidosus.AAC.3
MVTQPSGKSSLGKGENPPAPRAPHSSPWSLPRAPSETLRPSPRAHRGPYPSPPWGPRASNTRKNNRTPSSFSPGFPPHFSCQDLEDLAVFGAGRLSPLLAKHSGVIALFRALHVLGFVGRRPFVRAVLRFFGLVERSGHRGDLHNAVRADPLVHTPIEVVIVDVVTPVALSALLFLHYRAEALGLVHPSDGEHASGRIRMLVWVSLDHWRRRSLFLRRCTAETR